MKRKLSAAWLFVFVFAMCVLGQESSLFEEIRHAKQLNTEFTNISHFLVKTGEEVSMRKYFTHPENVSYFHCTSLDLNPENRAIRITIPIEGKDRVLELMEVPDSFYDYEVETQDGEVRKADRSIRHFRGIIEGVSNSFVAISFNKEKMFGIVSTNEGNYDIAPIRSSNKIVVYNDRNLNSKLDFTCGTTDDYSSLYPSDILMDNFSKNTPSTTSERVVRVYLETRYDIYQSKGSIKAVEEYISGILNQLSTLFQKEGISLNISKIYIWSKRDPYDGNRNSILSQFQDQRRKSSLDGDLGQLLIFENFGGLAAGCNGLCNPNVSERLSVAGISSDGDHIHSSFNWSVCVMAHELGHLLGSMHTHACVWNGNNTAIDGCSQTEGNCARPAIPANGGTIMSYCHRQDCGIDLSLGFGPQPGNVIRNSVRKAACLSECSISGPTEIEHQATYTIQNLPTGSSVRWSTNNGNLQLVSGQGTKTVVFRKNGSGECVIQATSSPSNLTITYQVCALPSRPTRIKGMKSQLAPNSQYGFWIDDAGDADYIEWTVWGGRIIGGQGASHLSVETASQGAFHIQVSKRNNCGWSGSCNDYGTINPGLAPFSLSPNPATDVVTLKLTTEEDDGILSPQGQGSTTRGVTNTYEIQLWNGLTMLRSFKTNQPTFQIPIARLPAGLYFVRVIKDGQTYTEKLIKN